MRPHVVHWLEGFMPGGVASALAPSWFTCVGLAGVTCLFLMLAIGRRHDIERRVIASIVLWCYLAAVTAGIVIPMAIDTLQQLFATGRVNLRWAGMTSFWGYLAGIAAVAAVCRAHRIPVARLLDLAAAPIGMALCFVRLGCFLAGCDYGKVTSVPWAVRFPAGSPAWVDHLQSGLLPPGRADSLPVHPTQLYEALLGLVMVGLALVARRSRWVRAREGRVFLVIAAAYALGRLPIEAVRGDAGRGIYLGLSSGQIFSLAVLLAIGVTIVARRRAAAFASVAAAFAIALFAPNHAEAQPAPATPAQPAAAAPQPPQPADAAPPPAQPAATPLPAAATPPPAQSTGAAPQPAAVAVVAAPPPTGITNGLEVGLLLGLASPINRRSDQVASLAGESLSVGYGIGRTAGVWLDFDNYSNVDAYHRTVLVSGSAMTRFGRFSFGGRVGAGATFVSFKDPVFTGATGSAFRFEALAEYAIARSWTLWARPITFDVMTASDLGGPITTFQVRIGAAYRFDLGGRARPAPAPLQPAPPPSTVPPPPAPPAPVTAEAP